MEVKPVTSEGPPITVAHEHYIPVVKLPIDRLLVREDPTKGDFVYPVVGRAEGGLAAVVAVCGVIAPSSALLVEDPLIGAAPASLTNKITRDRAV